jgi:hypothetical protein
MFSRFVLHSIVDILYMSVYTCLLYWNYHFLKFLPPKSFCFVFCVLYAILMSYFYIFSYKSSLFSTVSKYGSFFSCLLLSCVFCVICILFYLFVYYVIIFIFLCYFFNYVYFFVSRSMITCLLYCINSQMLPAALCCFGWHEELSIVVNVGICFLYTLYDTHILKF